MPRKTSKKTEAFRVFETNLDRSRAFLRIFDKDRKVGQPSNDEKELLRGSLVFAVGALDAYLSDLILEIVPEHGPKSAYMSDALKAIARADPGLSLRVALAATGPESRDEFRAALAEWLASKSFHGPEKVDPGPRLPQLPAGMERPGQRDWPRHGEGVNEDHGRQTRDRSRREEAIHQSDLAEQANALVAALARQVDVEVCKLYPPS